MNLFAWNEWGVHMEWMRCSHGMNAEQNATCILIDWKCIASTIANKTDRARVWLRVRMWEGERQRQRWREPHRMVQKWGHQTLVGHTKSVELCFANVTPPESQLPPRASVSSCTKLPYDSGMLPAGRFADNTMREIWVMVVWVKWIGDQQRVNRMVWYECSIT